MAADKNSGNPWKLVQDILKTTLWNSIGKAAGLLVPIVIALWFAVTRELDIFFLAYGVVIFLSTIFSATITTVLIPHIAEARSRQENPGALIGSLLLYATLSMLILSVIVNVLVPVLADRFTPFSTENIRNLTWLCLELTPLALLLVYASVLDGALNACKKFMLPALSPAFRALVNILLIYCLKEQWGVHAIIIGYIAGEALRITLLFLEIRRRQLFTIVFTWQYSRRLAAFLQNALFQILGMVLVSLNPVIDKTMAAWLEPGSVSILYYGDRLYTILAAFAISGLMVILLTNWSEQYYTMHTAGFTGRVQKAARVTFLAALVPVALCILCSKPLTRFLFARVTAAAGRGEEIARVFSCYMLGFIPYLLTQVYTRGLIVLKSTAPFLYCGAAMCGLNVLLNWLLLPYLKTAGLALATSLVNLLSCIYLQLMFLKKSRQKEIPCPT